MNNKPRVIKFTRTRDVKLPQRGNPTDAGIDFFVPKFDKEFVAIFKEKNPTLYLSDWEPTNSNSLTISGTDTNQGYNLDLTDNNDSIIKFDEDEGKSYFPLLPGTRINIPSGIHCLMETTDTALIGANKSGIASKHGLLFGAHVIDYEYQGEIHLNLINTSTKIVRIYEDMKIIQFIETPIYTSKIAEEINTEELYKNHNSDRGSGGFGSTNK